MPEIVVRKKDLLKLQDFCVENKWCMKKLGQTADALQDNLLERNFANLRGLACVKEDVRG